MTKRYIDVGEDKWGIILLYDFAAKDEDDMAAIMASFGMKPKNVDYALRVISTYNSGLTISRDDLRMSVVFIGNPSSRSQFWNTISHELAHVATAIIDYYGEPYDGEPAAYLSGYLLQRVVEEIAEPCK